MDRPQQYYINRVIFDKGLEEFLSHCPNMVDEDDKRDLCKEHGCPMYIYCVSIEPSETYFTGQENLEDLLRWYQVKYGRSYLFKKRINEYLSELVLKDDE